MTDGLPQRVLDGKLLGFMRCRIRAKGRDGWLGFDRLLQDATARKINMIAAWSVDRLTQPATLGRFPTDLRALGCNLYLHQQALVTPARLRTGHVSNVWRLRRV